MSKGFLETPMGTLEIMAESGKITGVELLRGKAECVEEFTDELDCSEIMKAKKQLTEYFDGNRQTFDLNIELRGTDFQVAVWNVLMTIPYGQTMSYGQVAAAAGKPKAQRAAGSNIGKNPLLIVVPCHRVISGDGSLGGFSSGIENKIILQKIENIDIIKRGNR
ncbi:MAG: methylated-DNA--[Firmicutes bacterium]|nr:methylated-DNA--[protein]-cysteine S-methyltransferase [Bacillota bacterium]